MTALDIMLGSREGIFGRADRQTGEPPNLEPYRLVSGVSCELDGGMTVCMRRFCSASHAPSTALRRKRLTCKSHWFESSVAHQSLS